MRQGNDIVTPYRSVIYTTTEEQYQQVCDSKIQYQSLLSQNGYSEITTEIKPLDIFYYAEEEEEEHQQYLAKNKICYKQNEIIETSQIQLFLHDPMGNKIELNFLSAMS